MKIKLRHYGSAEYSPGLFNPISDRRTVNKPIGGLWTSPAVSKYGWLEFCKRESFGSTNVFFDVEFCGSLFVVDGEKDMNKLPWVGGGINPYISFQSMCLSGFDAIHLTAKGEQETRCLYPRSMCGWDCETVLILNPGAIKVIESR